MGIKGRAGLPVDGWVDGMGYDGAVGHWMAWTRVDKLLLWWKFVVYLFRASIQVSHLSHAMFGNSQGSAQSGKAQ